ncbi:MAG TPA: FtsX-like permease family protein [Longimicrobium sp.]|jgi:putative ABC transport system permease protein|uniref:ABC transporter permease n=1 Tax=Longimicrobium sp. TaxID=2029185 RepID=UPI002ED8FE88
MLLKYALRGIGRRKKESALLVLVVLVSAYVILAQAAQRRGVEMRAKRVLVESLSGEFLMYRSARGGIDVLDAQMDEMETFHADPARVAAAAASVPGATIEPRLRFGALVSSGEESSGMYLQAVSAAQLRRLASALEFKTGGMEDRAADGLVLSEAMAKQLGAAVGDTLVVLATNRDGYMQDDALRVTGIFRGKGIASFLVPVGFIPYARGEAMLNLAPGETAELVVSLPAQMAGDREAAVRRAAEAIAPSLRVAEWNKTAPLFSAILSVWRGSGAITQTVFCALSFLLLLNVVLMKVHHRRKEVGTLLALGYGRGWVTSLVAVEYLLVTWIGFALAAWMVFGLAMAFGRSGIPIGSEAMQAAYMGSKIYPRLLLADVVQVLAMFSVVALLAATLPVLRFRSVEPSRLLRTAT